MIIDLNQDVVIPIIQRNSGISEDAHQRLNGSRICYNSFIELEGIKHTVC